MSEYTDVLERIGDRAPMPEPALERMVGRRERLRRNRRISAGALASIITAVLVLALVNAVPKADHEPVDSPSPTPIDGTAPLDLLPPAGSELTTGGVGQLVFWYRGGVGAGTTQWLFLYTDGRLITNAGPLDETLDARWFERRLAPEGVQLMIDAVGAPDLPVGGSAILAPRATGWNEYSAAPGFEVVTWGPRSWVSDPDIVADPEASAALDHLRQQLLDPSGWLPSSAWERAEQSRFAPPTYLVTVEPLDEGSASDEWLSGQRELDDLPLPTGLAMPAIRECVTVDLATARNLASVLDDAGMRFSWDAFIGLDSDPGTGMVWSALTGGRPVVIRIGIPLPHEDCSLRPDR